MSFLGCWDEEPSGASSCALAEGGWKGPAELLADAGAAVFAGREQLQPRQPPTVRGADELVLVASPAVAIGRAGKALEALPGVHVAVQGDAVGRLEDQLGVADVVAAADRHLERAGEEAPERALAAQDRLL